MTRVSSKIHYVGQLQQANQRPENVEIVVEERANFTTEEAAAGIIWVDSRYEPGDVRRYGAIGDGIIDDTVAIRAAVDQAEQGGDTAHGNAGDLYRIDTTTALFTGGGVTYNVAIEMKSTVVFDGRGCRFIHAGDAGDIVTSQFTFFANDETTTELRDFGVINAEFENDGTANVYVNGVIFWGGSSAQAANLIKRPVAKNIIGIETRVVVISRDTDPAETAGKVHDGIYHNIHGVNAGAAVAALETEVRADIKNISADVADFDVLLLSKGNDITVQGVRGTTVTDFIINISNTLTTAQILENVSISDVTCDSGSARVSTSGTSTAILRGIRWTNLNVLDGMTVQDSTSGGTGVIQNIYCEFTSRNSTSRGFFVSNASSVHIKCDVKNPALAGGRIQNSSDCVVEGIIDLTGITDENCLELDRANNFNGDVRVLGGDDGLFLIGVTGTMGGASVHVVASGQNDKAVDWDATASSTSRVRVWGDYNGQATAFGNVEGSVIELEDREGIALTIASDELAAVFSRVHVVNAQSGTTDNLQDINSGIQGQVVTFFGATGDILTVKHATGGGNIRTQTGSDVIITPVIPIALRFNGTNWCEIGNGSGQTRNETVTTTNVITADESGKTFFLNAVGGFTSTLPVPAAGLKYKFIVSTAPTTAYIITTNSSANILFGFFLDIVGEQVYFSAQDTLNFVASTSLVGDFLEVESDGTNWYCVAKSGADGGITVAVT